MQNSSRLKILYLTKDKYPPVRADVVSLFAEEFKKRGHQIWWVFRSEAALSKFRMTRWCGHPAFVIPSINGGIRGRVFNFWFDIYRYFMFIKLAMRSKFDFIQVRDDVPGGVAAVIASKVTKMPFTYWMSYPMSESQMDLAKAKPLLVRWLFWSKGWLGYVILYRFVLPNADHVFVQSQQMKADIADKGINLAKVTPVPMGIQLDKFSGFVNKPFQQNAKLVTKKPVIAYLGTLIRTRKMEFMVDVLAGVHKQLPEVLLQFVGDGLSNSDVKPIMNRIEELDLTNYVEITGMLSQQEAWKRIAKADVCVSPFAPGYLLNSTSPTKLIEYMVMAKPFVANDHPEQSKVIEESGAGICVPWDATAFSEAIVYLLTNKEAAQKMADKGPEYVKKNRTYEILSSVLIEKYQELKEEGINAKEVNQ